MQREQGCEQIRVTTLEKPRKYVFFLLLTHPRPFVHSSSKERLAYCSVLNNSPAPVWDYDDYSAQLPGLSYWGQDFYLFFCQDEYQAWIFIFLQNYPVDEILPGFLLNKLAPRMIIKSTFAWMILIGAVCFQLSKVFAQAVKISCSLDWVALLDSF